MAWSASVSHHVDDVGGEGHGGAGGGGELAQSAVGVGGKREQSSPELAQDCHVRADEMPHHGVHGVHLGYVHRR